MTPAKKRRLERINALLRNIAGAFAEAEICLPETIVTITRAETTGDLRRAKIFFSVFPEEKEKEVCSLLKKKCRDLRDCVKAQVKMRTLPVISFEIDRAAKIERRIEEILAT